MIIPTETRKISGELFLLAKRSKQKSIIPFLLGLLAGFGLSLLTIYTRPPNHPLEERKRALESTFGESLATGPRDIEAAETLLRDLLIKIESKQKDDPGFVKGSKRLIALAEFDPALASAVPKQFQGMIIVRADGVDAKIMMDWRLCGIAQVLAPKLLDPVRSHRKTLGCPYFGLWTPGAAKW